MSDAGLCVALINWYAIPRGLHHCRDLAEPEPFDFLTWFEFAQKATAEFDQLLKRLRASEEWKYVERDSISPL